MIKHGIGRVKNKATCLVTSCAIPQSKSISWFMDPSLWIAMPLYIYSVMDDIHLQSLTCLLNIYTRRQTFNLPFSICSTLFVLSLCFEKKQISSFFLLSSTANSSRRACSMDLNSHPSPYERRNSGTRVHCLSQPDEITARLRGPATPDPSAQYRSSVVLWMPWQRHR